MLERIFKLKEHQTNVRTEVIAGITTFMTMAYIIFVNPLILSDAGMDQGAVTTATILAAAITTFLMGVYVNYPFALASGMGLNAFFAYTVAANYGWQAALGAVFISGIVFLILAVTNAITYIDKAVPLVVKRGVAAAIGLFIALIGLRNAGIVVDHPSTLVTLGDVTAKGPLLAIIGLAITAILMALRVRGAILIGILITTIIGIPMGVTEFQGIFGLPAGLSPIFFKMDIAGAIKTGFFVIFS